MVACLLAQMALLFRESVVCQNVQLLHFHLIEIKVTHPEAEPIILMVPSFVFLILCFMPLPVNDAVVTMQMFDRVILLVTKQASD